VSAIERPPIPAGTWESWGENLSDYLVRIKPKLAFVSSNDAAVDNGVILWNSSGYPVVSKSNSYRQIALADGYSYLSTNTDATASSADTAYTITYDAPTIASQISRDSSNTTRITIAEAGTYYLMFSAQCKNSNSAGDFPTFIDFQFWLKKNGTNIAESAKKFTVYGNAATQAVSAPFVATLAANDYIESCWMSSSTSGSLDASAAAGDVPAIPAASLTIHRLTQ